MPLEVDKTCFDDFLFLNFLYNLFVKCHAVWARNVNKHFIKRLYAKKIVTIVNECSEFNINSKKVLTFVLLWNTLKMTKRRIFFFVSLQWILIKSNFTTAHRFSVSIKEIFYILWPSERDCWLKNIHSFHW